MRTVMNERAAVTVNTANHIRTDFVSDHPKSRPEYSHRHRFGLTGCLSVTDKQFFCVQKRRKKMRNISWINTENDTIDCALRMRRFQDMK